MENEEMKRGEEKEDLNNDNSIVENIKEGEMAKEKLKRCPTGTRRSKSGKSCQKKTTNKKVKKAKFKWW